MCATQFLLMNTLEHYIAFFFSTSVSGPMYIASSKKRHKVLLHLLIPFFLPLSLSLVSTLSLSAPHATLRMTRIEVRMVRIL